MSISKIEHEVALCYQIYWKLSDQNLSLFWHVQLILNTVI
jgi:hypothetical protein